MPALARVLVVEDEPDVADMLQELLVDLGYEVEIAVSGQEALGLVPVYRPDAVLLDLNMPGLPGSQVLEQLLRVDPHLPVIIVTGNSDLEVARRTLQQGAFDYVSKPFDLRVLRALRIRAPPCAPSSTSRTMPPTSTSWSASWSSARVSGSCRRTSDSWGSTWPASTGPI